MFKLKIVKIIAFLSAIVGGIVIIGWIFDITFLKSILPNMVEMKFTTAVCFVATGFILYSISKENAESSFLIQTTLPSAIFLILILMGTLFITSISGISTSIDNLFIQEKAGAINTVVPGRPSVPTMLNFILVAISGGMIFTKLEKYLIWIGSIIMLIGGVAVLGYIIKQPILYYLIVGVNTAMAIHTAILFVLIGIAFILCGKTISRQN